MSFLLSYFKVQKFIDKKNHVVPVNILIVVLLIFFINKKVCIFETNLSLFW